MTDRHRYDQRVARRARIDGRVWQYRREVVAGVANAQVNALAIH
jgi:hypothetical protein